MFCIQQIEQLLFPLVGLQACEWFWSPLWHACFLEFLSRRFMCCHTLDEQFLFPYVCGKPYWYFEHALPQVLPCWPIDDDVFDIPLLVFLPNSPLIATKILTNFSFWCFACNSAHMFQNEIVPIALSNVLGDFVFPHFEDVSLSCLHIDLAFALPSIYLCCANRVMNKIGHVLNDVLLL